ncbi:transcriptional regulator [Streptomyces inusitatus]|uniref:Transcriptional regulator n=1 Tax=Streptomyces inusitatus TaxID=68221 RepID=A0A918PTN4_9ACTN|nr:helix-turn-helix transcriptional regulator [Streptomyces inusitatus]GGZ21624.1 transcriptional regulator [Streptomyces inusitatus]
MITNIESATPALCRLHLGTELRQLRLAAELRANQVVRRLLWSPSKLTRLETGENASVEPSDVIALCDMYGADADKRALLTAYAAVTKTKKDWWQTDEYRPAISPTFKAYLGLEETAASMHKYEAEYVPGLLQTEEYVRGLHQQVLKGNAAEGIEKWVAVRMARQEVLRRAELPLRFTAVINEAVLLRQTASPAVMRAQLEHIAEVASSLPSVRVQVIPFKSGAHVGMDGAFTLLRFRESEAMKPIVYLEGLVDAQVVRSTADVTRYDEAFTELQADALGPKESLSMIREAIKEY